MWAGLEKEGTRKTIDQSQTPDHSSSWGFLGDKIPGLIPWCWWKEWNQAVKTDKEERWKPQHKLKQINRKIWEKKIHIKRKASITKQIKYQQNITLDCHINFPFKVIKTDPQIMPQTPRYSKPREIRPLESTLVPVILIPDSSRSLEQVSRAKSSEKIKVT